MSFIELTIIGIGLGMDSFAVAICKGLSMIKMSWKKAIVIGAYFGIFQAIMPLIGHFLGMRFESQITSIDHWVTFIFLGIIGSRMIIEAFEKENKEIDDSIDIKTMIVLAIATSIDALAIGVTFAFFDVNILLAISIIGIIAFSLSIIGVKIGNIFGNKYKSKAEIAGGVILILMGTKILLEHLNIINF